MALSSNIEEAHIPPGALYPKCASEHVRDVLRSPLLLDPSSTGGLNFSPGLLAEIPHITPCFSQVSHSVSIGIAAPYVLRLQWCDLGCFPLFL